MSSKSMVYWCTTEEVAHISDPARPLHQVFAPFLVSSPTNQVSFCYSSCTKHQAPALAPTPHLLYQAPAAIQASFPVPGESFCSSCPVPNLSPATKPLPQYHASPPSFYNSGKESFPDTSNYL